ncbi:MAG: tRNA (adenosine(37)-N6)-dimethylallyltransferase MiaA [Candidatus Hydrogenedentes bacterium]|nr:tRNA (adenosine(37)-N6)-dimethylallyltransferase MiaA [Candidatus Hydrogenedentota bacterium]
MIPILAVVGPTASGKTALAIDLAERLETEIISADSMQVYKGMEIGTGAPTLEEQARVKHHFVSFLDPGVKFSAGEFERLAREVVIDLNKCGKTAVVVGGSGLYLRALIDGLFDGPGADESLRGQLNTEAEKIGTPAMYERLVRIDPAYAAQIKPTDLKRIVRALEVHAIAGEPLSVLHAQHRAAHPPLESVQFLIDWPRAVLYDRINARVDQMLANGFIDEVRRLDAQGHAPALLRLRSLGYREFLSHIHGHQTLEHATDRMKQLTRNFAKRQLTWFRADKRITWIAMNANMDRRHLADTFLKLFLVS